MLFSFATSILHPNPLGLQLYNIGMGNATQRMQSWTRRAYRSPSVPSFNSPLPTSLLQSDGWGELYTVSNKSYKVQRQQNGKDGTFTDDSDESVRNRYMK